VKKCDYTSAKKMEIHLRQVREFRYLKKFEGPNINTITSGFGNQIITKKGKRKDKD